MVRAFVFAIVHKIDHISTAGWHTMQHFHPILWLNQADYGLYVAKIGRQICLADELVQKSMESRTIDAKLKFHSLWIMVISTHTVIFKWLGYFEKAIINDFINCMFPIFSAMDFHCGKLWLLVCNFSLVRISFDFSKIPEIKSHKRAIHKERIR